jgi:hypothetical protein
MQSITKIRNFQPSDLTFSDIATNKYGGKFLYLNGATGRIYLQLPKMKMPFNVSEFVPKDPKTGQPTGEDSRYSLNLSFYGMGENPKLKQCYDRLTSTDERIMSAAIENHDTWFPGQYGKYKDDPTKLQVAIETLYNPLVKQDNSGKYPANIRIKLPRYDGVFKMEIYDKSDRSKSVAFGINVDDGEVPITKYLTKGTYLTPIVSVPMINFMKGFGTGFTLVQAIAEPVVTFGGSCVIDDSDDEEEEQTSSSPAQQGNLILDSDDEDDEDNDVDENVVVDSGSDEDEPEPEPTPTPVKKKRGGRRKKTAS